MAGKITIHDIEQAAERIGPYIHRTPVLTCSALDEISGAQLFFKCENLQKTGSFKIRGAANAVLCLTGEEATHGVATHSSGNYAAALALAARWRGVSAHVVMPENAPAVKKDAVAGYGAQITFCAPTLEAREKGLARVIKRTGARFLHPFNDQRVIAGQGTAALELCEEVPDLDVVMAPVGGGGLLSGTAIATCALTPAAQVVAAEPAGADDAYRSLNAGRIIPSVEPDTVADGLLTSLGDQTFPIIARFVREIVLVSEDEILRAMRLVWERMKMVIEPSAAVPVGALLGRPSRFRGQRIGILLSGGNVDLDDLPFNRG